MASGQARIDSSSLCNTAKGGADGASASGESAPTIKACCQQGAPPEDDVGEKPPPRTTHRQYLAEPAPLHEPLKAVEERSLTPPLPVRSPYANLPSKSMVDLSRARRNSSTSTSPLDSHYPFLSPFSISSNVVGSTATRVDESQPVASWPSPDAYSFASVPRCTCPKPPGEQCQGPCTHTSLSSSLSRAMRPRSLSSSKVIHLEVGLVNSLADFLEEDGATLEAIRGASGVLSLYLKDKPVTRRIVCCGTASTLNKARQLLDAKLSQTPFRVVFALRVPHDTPLSHVLSLYPIPRGPAAEGAPPRPQLRRFICHAPALQPTLSSPVSPSLPRAAREASDSPITPSSSPSSKVFDSPVAPQVSPGSPLTTPLTTPVSSRHQGADSYFAARPGLPSPSGSASSVPLVGDCSGISPLTSTALPAIGSFVANREAYIAALVDELESQCTHRNIVRVKVFVGVQGWLRDDEKVHNDEQIYIAELEQLPLPTTWPFRSPSFTTALSEAEAHALLDRVRASRDGFVCTRQTSQVRMTLLDKCRPMYYVASADVKGADLRKVRDDSTGSGTLFLKKCTTPPSMPFSLSLGAPGIVDEAVEGRGMRDAIDLRFKVLADKAGTSPSDELYKAMQRATWGVDPGGVFVVNAELDKTRYDPSQTHIKWEAKERWQNDTMRATLIESRVADSTSHTWEVCLSSPVLNDELFGASVDWFKRGWDRAKVERLVGELVDWAIEVVGG